VDDIRPSSRWLHSYASRGGLGEQLDGRLFALDHSRRHRGGGGLQYTGHALDQMRNRGMTPSVVEDTIARGTQSAGHDGAMIFQTDQARVILNPNGTVKTVTPASH